jgi:ABC-type multidrug transport system fused ATPase/permease subunit
VVQIKELRGECFRHLLRQEIGFFDEDANSAGELTEFLAAKIAFVQGMCGEKLQIIVGCSIQFFMGVVFMFVLGDWRITLCAICSVRVLRWPQTNAIVAPVSSADSCHSQPSAASRRPGLLRCRCRLWVQQWQRSWLPYLARRARRAQRKRAPRTSVRLGHSLARCVRDKSLRIGKGFVAAANAVAAYTFQAAANASEAVPNPNPAP